MIYLDHAATTKPDQDVLEAMLPYLKENYGNSQSQYSLGRQAAIAVTNARDYVSSVLGCTSEEVYFTSGGTESDNWALRGIYESTKGHIVLSAIEHPALLSLADDLKKEGADITYVYPGFSGRINPKDVEAAIKDNTCFVGVMSANNETGVIQPTDEIARICKERGIFFFSDCVQSAAVLPFEKGLSGLSFSAHKFYGPKGVGVLYIKKGTPISRLIAGGRQERGLRGGTTNVAGIVGLHKALEIALSHMDENNKKVVSLRDAFLDRVLCEIEGTFLNGDRNLRLPANANISFDGCLGEQILVLLDMKGIAVSTGSACAAGAVTPSHVLTAMGLDEGRCSSAVRFTFGKDNTPEEVDETVECLKQIVTSLKK